MCEDFYAARVSEPGSGGGEDRAGGGGECDGGGDDDDGGCDDECVVDGFGWTFVLMLGDVFKLSILERTESVDVAFLLILTSECESSASNKATTVLLFLVGAQARLLLVLRVGLSLSSNEQSFRSKKIETYPSLCNLVTNTR